MMRLLLIDTCGTEGSVALAEGGSIVGTETLPGRTSSERLVPAVRIATERQGWRLQDLTAIVVVRGPGSFTGVRVGLSAAKGLSEASGTPLIAVSRLALLAGTMDHVCAVLDAGRGEFYFGEYRYGRCVVEALLTKDELVNASRSVVVACESRVAEALQGSVQVTMIAEPRAQDALEIALRRAKNGEFDDAAEVDANYLRRTDEQLFARPKVAAV